METKRDSITAREHRWLNVVVVNVAHAFAHLNIQGLSVLWPLLQEEFGFGYTGIAGLVVVSGLVGGIDVIYGFVTRFIRRVHVMAIGTLIAFAGIVGIVSSQNYGQLMASKVVNQFGTSPNHPVGGAIMADSFPKSRSKAFALYMSCANVGSWVAPLIVGGMLYLMNWRLVMLIISLPVLLASIFFFCIKEPAPRSDPGEGTTKRARFALTEYKTAFRDRNVIILGLVMMVGACGRGVGGLNTYLAPFMVDRFGVSVSFAAMFVAVYTFSGIVGPLAMGWVADKISPGLALRITLALSAGFTLLFLVPKTPGITLALVIFLAGFFISCRGILTQSMLVNLGPKGVRIDTLLGVYGTMGALTGPLWTLVTGVVVDKFGITPAFLIMALTYVLGLIILGFFKFAPTNPVTPANA